MSTVISKDNIDSSPYELFKGFWLPKPLHEGSYQSHDNHRVRILGGRNNPKPPR